MRVPRLLVALAVAGALLSPALAHRPPAPYFPDHVIFSRTVDAAIRRLETLQVKEAAETGVTIAVSRSQSLARYVRWGGAIVIGATAVLTALDWFYNEAKKTTGTSLDDWWNWEEDPHFPAPQGDPPYDLEFVCWGGASSSNAAGYDYYLGRPTSTTAQSYRAVYSWDGGSLTKIASRRPIEDARAYAESLCQGRPPLPDWIQDHPDATDGVKQALGDYVTSNDPSSFSDPWPGIQLDPPPTGNQWWDNPFFNPYEDTDGDGWPDWFEWDVGADPSNPGSQPYPGGDPDGDGYDNAAERDAGTDPTDPNSRPGVDQDQDTDGDGLKDSADPCPNDPNNQCQPEEEENPDEIPDPSEPSLTPVDLPQLDQPELPEIASRFDQVRTNFEQNLQTLWDTLQDRFPVGMARWIPAPPSVSGGSCDMSFQLEIPDLPPANIDICNNPVMQWAASTGRRIVLASLMVGFLFAIARRASHA